MLRASFVSAVMLGFAGAAWSVGKGEGCDSCKSVALLAGDLNLGLMGLVFYTVLLGLSLWMLRRHPVSSPPALPPGIAIPVLVAGGVHLTLMALLVKNRLFCASCATTAIGAFAATAIVLVSRVVRFRWSALALAAVAAMTFVGLKWMKGDATQVALRQARLARQQLLREAPPVPGVARMVVFAHPTCHVCARFNEQVLAPLRKEYPSTRLLIEERKAWTGMATPTSVILGQHPALLVGFKDLPEVRKAVQEACGNSTAQQATSLRHSDRSASRYSAAQ